MTLYFYSSGELPINETALFTTSLSDVENLLGKVVQKSRRGRIVNSDDNTGGGLRHTKQIAIMSSLKISIL